MEKMPSLPPAELPATRLRQGVTEGSTSLLFTLAIHSVLCVIAPLAFLAAGAALALSNRTEEVRENSYALYAIAGALVAAGVAFCCNCVGVPCVVVQPRARTSASADDDQRVRCCCGGRGGRCRRREPDDFALQPAPPRLRAAERALRRVLVVVNPSCCDGSARVLYEEVVQPIFAAAGIDADVVVTKRRGHAREVCAAVGSATELDAIVVVGGDGTLHECVGGMLSRAENGAPPLPIGLVPCGRTNSIAADLGDHAPGLYAAAAAAAAEGATDEAFAAVATAAANTIVAGQRRTVDVVRVACVLPGAREGVASRGAATAAAAAGEGGERGGAVGAQWFMLSTLALAADHCLAGLNMTEAWAARLGGNARASALCHAWGVLKSRGEAIAASATGVDAVSVAGRSLAPQFARYEKRVGEARLSRREVDAQIRAAMRGTSGALRGGAADEDALVADDDRSPRRETPEPFEFELDPLAFWVCKSRFGRLCGGGGGEGCGGEGGGDEWTAWLRRRSQCSLPRARLDDGRMDFGSVCSLRRGADLCTFAALRRSGGRERAGNRVDSLRCSALRLELLRDEGLLAIDGEVVEFNRSCLELQVLEGAYELFAPVAGLVVAAPFPEQELSGGERETQATSGAARATHDGGLLSSSEPSSSSSSSSFSSSSSQDGEEEEEEEVEKVRAE